MPDWVRDWVPFASLLGMIIGILITVLKSAPIVPAGRVATLRQTIADQGMMLSNQGAEILRLTQAFDRQTVEITKLKDRIDFLLGDNEYWRNKARDADRLAKRQVRRNEDDQ